MIGLMNSADVFGYPAILSQVAATFEEPAVDGVYSDMDYVLATDMSKIVCRWRSGTYTPERLRKGWMPPHPTLYLRRTVFEISGTYDTSKHIAADYEAILRYLVKGQIRLSYLPTIMVEVCLGGKSNRFLGQLEQKSKEDLRALRRHWVCGIGTLAAKNFSKIKLF